MQRKSLAPVSASAMNARQSIAPRQSLAPGKMSGGRATLSGRKSSFGGRQSMAAQGRRSTLAPGSKQMEDPRNVKDKAFIRAAQQRVIEFLVANNYERQISQKMLEAPATKDFLHILQFLYNKIDPKFQLGPNTGEEIPAIFKRLRYPFNISKSHLQAVGSPHAWPSLLGALVWLVELLQYEKQVEFAMQEDGLEGENPDKMFFDFLALAYDSFLQGSDNEQKLEEDLQAQFAQKNQATQDEVERVRKANEKMEQEIASLQDNKLEQLQEKRSLLIKDLEKFKQLIADLQKHHADVAAKVEEAKSSEAACEAEVREAEKTKAELQEVVASQEARNIDGQRIAGERARVQEELRVTAGERDKVTAETYQIEIQLANKQAELEREIQEYHRLATEMKIVPATAKHAGGESYEIPLQSRGNSLQDLVALGGKCTLKQDLAGLRDQIQGKAEAAQARRIEEEERLHETQVRVVERQEEVVGLEGEYKGREAQLQREKEALEEELRMAASEVQTIEDKVAHGGQAVKGRLQSGRQRLEGLQREVREMSAGVAKAKADRSDQLMALCSLAAQHKLNVQERLQDLETRLLALQAKISSS